MKEVYALVTSNCNLSCPHCNIRTINENFNKEKFMKALKEFDGRIILFGGEPSLYQDRLYEIYNSNIDIKKKIGSISTNLVKLNDDLLSIYKEIRYIASSWNPKRFKDNEYDMWLKNINTLAENDLNVLVLITLTDDLFKLGTKNVIDMIKTWNPKGVSAVRFEYLVADGLTAKYYEDADKWLCDIYSNWQSDIPMDLNPYYYWYYDCSNTYTLYPDGNLVKGCPNHKNISIPIECYSCDRSGVCRPCALQEHCSFPKKFAKLLYEREGKPK